jgi:hypothetical protein
MEPCVRLCYAALLISIDAQELPLILGLPEESIRFGSNQLVWLTDQTLALLEKTGHYAQEAIIT